MGAYFDNDGGRDRGAAWILLLNRRHGQVAPEDQRHQGGFTGTLDDNDYFGSSVASLGDLDGDGLGDLAVGRTVDDDGGSARGAVWVLFLDDGPTAPSTSTAMAI